MRIMQVITDYIARSILTTEGDMIVRGAAIPERFPPGLAWQTLLGQGAGVRPVWTFNLGGMNTKGDLSTFGTTYPVRLPAVAVGQVLKSMGIETQPEWGIPSIGDIPMAVSTHIRSTSGEEVVSGVGFEPKLVLFFTCDTTVANNNWSIGVDTGAILAGLYSYDGSSESSYTAVYSIYIRRSAGNTLWGKITATGGDGLTVTYTLTGTVELATLFLMIG